jgi:8-oxo-dGTP pyrophosphatase MutT (NUDIX family)
VEPADADLEAALRREAMEEIGATIGPAAEFLVLTEPRGTTTVVQHYFLADLLEMDLGRRHGPELDDPDTGDYVLRHADAWSS